MWIDQGASFGGKDDCYRYTLWRTWDRRLPTAVFAMLNPSTADAVKLDPTLTRCVKFARRWGAGKMLVVNIFALRSPHPRDLLEVKDPVGPLNNGAISLAAEEARNTWGWFVCGWGNHGALLERNLEVMVDLKVRLLPLDPLCLGVTDHGHPKHPLARGRAWIPDDFTPAPYRFFERPKA